MVFAFMEQEQPSKGKYSDSVVGTFRSGHQIKGRPIALSQWRVTTDDVDVAESIGENYGGSAQEWDNEKEPFEVFTTVGSVDIVIKAGSLRSELNLFGRSGPPLRVCDGVTQSGSGNEGRPCECPATLADRKEAAKTGRGCQPNVSFLFSLASTPDLGLFRFRTGSWVFAQDLGKLEDALNDIDGDAKAVLKLEQVTAKGSGKTFTIPKVLVKGQAS